MSLLPIVLVTFTSVLQVVTQCLAEQTTFRDFAFPLVSASPRGREAATRPELKITWWTRQAIQGDDVRLQPLTCPVLAVIRTLLYFYPFSVPILLFPGEILPTANSKSRSGYPS